MYIGIDIGGTTTKIGLFENSTSLLQKKEFTTNKEYEKFLTELISAVDELKGEEKLDGIGIGVPARISKEGIIEGLPNLYNWENKPLVDDMRQKYETLVKLENDASIAARAEATSGAGMDINRFLYITWGTGIGGKSVNKSESTVQIGSMEPGHQILDVNGPLCGCGQKGCLEVYCGGKYFIERYVKQPSEFDITDPVWENISLFMSHGLVNALHLFPTDTIIFGGGFITKQSHLLEKIRNNLTNMTSEFYRPQLYLSKYKEDAGIYGAVSLFFGDLI